MTLADIFNPSVATGGAVTVPSNTKESQGTELNNNSGFNFYTVQNNKINSPNKISYIDDPPENQKSWWNRFTDWVSSPVKKVYGDIEMFTLIALVGVLIIGYIIAKNAKVKIGI